MSVRLMTVALCLISQTALFANGIAVTNVSIASQNTTSKYKMIKLDVAWSNSWRTYNYESNYDAAWVFIKYRKLSGGPWMHATLNYVNGTADGHTKATSSDINTTADGKGVFVFRASSSPTNFIGAASYKNMQLRWNYGVDGLADTELVEVAVFAVEMVYVPQGAFYVGDGSTGTSSVTSARFQDGASTTPFYITSENQITLGGTTAGNLSEPYLSSANRDDFSVNSATTQILPATFPKGFRAFYCMKYEVSQEQYAEFLKKLTPTQAAARYSPEYFGRFRYSIDASFVAGAPDRACNMMNYLDMTAYADWSGLRPMTELEYEKACRGPVFPVPFEFPWGNTVFRILTGISSDGTSAETDNNTPRANLHCGHGTGFNETDVLFGPMRCGWTVGGSRELSGDTFYGISDMAGNVEETTIGIGVAVNRNFTGTHGDGNLTPEGNADNADWPSISPLLTNVKVRFKGGSVFGTLTPQERSTVSRRYDNTFISFMADDRFPYFGFRGVRSAN